MSEIKTCAPSEEDAKFWLDVEALNYYLRAYVMAQRLGDAPEMGRKRTAIEGAGYILEDTPNGAQWRRPEES